VFSVADLSLRKKLISAYRANQKAWPAFMQTKLEEGHKKLAKAQRRAASLPWLRAGLLAAFCVAIGRLSLSFTALSRGRWSASLQGKD
jgi:hypothetical protein